MWISLCLTYKSAHTSFGEWLQEQSSQKGGEGSLFAEVLLAFFLEHPGRQVGR